MTDRIAHRFVWSFFVPSPPAGGPWSWIQEQAVNAMRLVYSPCRSRGRLFRLTNYRSFRILCLPDPGKRSTATPMGIARFEIFSPGRVPTHLPTGLERRLFFLQTTSNASMSNVLH